MKKSAILFLLLCISLCSFAQGTFSGDLMMNLNFFQRDTNIKASGNPLYDNYLSGSEAWLSLRYNINGFTFFARADAFNNSNLKNPTSANTNFGLGAWSISKDINDLSITVGSIYDQVGSGLLFRAYEDRGLLIDNALIGIQLKYSLTKNILLKGFMGQQKNNDLQSDQNINARYAPIIRGFNAEGDFNAGTAHLVPGIGVLNRTLDGSTMNDIAASINAQELSTRFEPMYNMYAFCGYNTLTYKNLSWYVEGDYKTHEAILNTNNILVNKPGNVAYTAINYGRKGIALSLTGKRTENFVMRIINPPGKNPLNGMLNRQPVIAFLRPERLIARYTPASQDISEMAGSANLQLSPNDETNFTLSYTHIDNLSGEKLYREGFVEANYQGLKSWIVQVGAQFLEYNLALYQAHGKADPILKAITPFTEITYRLSDEKSIRAEVQYMLTQQDYGSWAFVMLEYNIAPTWSIAASDMYNITPNKGVDNPNYKGPGIEPKSNHYYNIFTSYTKGPHRFSIAYVKQVDGINCSGGVCRYEPAFSGVKATVTTRF
jgi:hypothetical protein